LSLPSLPMLSRARAGARARKMVSHIDTISYWNDIILPLPFNCSSSAFHFPSSCCPCKTYTYIILFPTLNLLLHHIIIFWNYVL
jgi:hypothetical protein